MLILDEEETRIINGERGRGLAMALRTVVRYGEVLGARKLVPISSAHLVGSFMIFLFRDMYRMIDLFVNEGLQVAVPTTLNPRPGRGVSWLSRFLYAKQNCLERALASLGVSATWSCLPYEDREAPKRGEVLAWAESSAVFFANSVLGARTNLHALGVDLCCAMTGRTPEYGLLLDENRQGRVRVNFKLDRMDAGVLGYCIGEQVGNRIPVLQEYPFSRSELRSLGAGMACSSHVGLFHVMGVTPEAPTASALSHLETITVTQGDLDRYESRSPGRPDLVIFGCPLLVRSEVQDLSELFVAKKVRCEVLFCVNPNDLLTFRQSASYAKLIESGVRVESFCPLAAYLVRVRYPRIMSPSIKLCRYVNGIEYGTMETCLQACGVTAC